MAQEKALWGWLSCAKRKMGPILHINRIENLLEAGTPDVEFFINDPNAADPFKAQGWIELKSHERPAKKTTPIRFALRGRESQIHWLETRWRLSGNSWFLLQIGSSHERALYLAPGHMGNMLKQGLTEGQIMGLCAAHGGVVFPSNVTPETVLRTAATCRLGPKPLRK